MGVIKAEKREGYAKIIAERYRAEGLPTSAIDIEKATGNKRQAVLRVLVRMAREGEIAMVLGKTVLCFPPDVLMPSPVIRAAAMGKQRSAVLRGATNEVIFIRMLECLGEFYRRGLTMGQLAEYARTTGL